MSLLKLPECIHLSGLGRCDELRVKKCIGSKCSFMQSKDEKKQSVARWNKRLNTIGLQEQSTIANKYYGGKTPWSAQKEEV